MGEGKNAMPNQPVELALSRSDLVDAARHSAAHRKR